MPGNITLQPLLLIVGGGKQATLIHRVISKACVSLSSLSSCQIFHDHEESETYVLLIVLYT
jgi:hypothetical protein